MEMSLSRIAAGAAFIVPAFALTTYMHWIDQQEQQKYSVHSVEPPPSVIKAIKSAGISWIRAIGLAIIGASAVYGTVLILDDAYPSNPAEIIEVSQ